MKSALKHEAGALPDPGLVLGKAVLNAGAWLGLSAAALAPVLGLSESGLSRLKSGGMRLKPGAKEFELAALFVRLFRSLDAITGGDQAAARAWLDSENRALGGVPLRLIRTVTGLVETLAYLDAARARI
jgi:hypothetical protein